MAALEAGKTAPSFSLPLLAAGQFSLKEALARGPVVVAFFKISCPVCQFTFPYLQRLHEAVKDANVTIVGVSQNNKEHTAAFAREYRITFPIALDDPSRYPVSNDFGITNVPTVFYIAQDGRIEISSVGWSRGDLESIAHDIGERKLGTRIQVIRGSEDVPAFKAG